MYNILNSASEAANNAAQSIDFKIDVQALIDSLPIMGMGMLGIFAVTCVIILSVWLLNKFAK